MHTWSSDVALNIHLCYFTFVLLINVNENINQYSCWNDTPLSLGTTGWLLTHAFGKNQQKHSVRINWLHRIITKSVVYFIISHCGLQFFVITIYNACVCSYAFRVLFVPGELVVRCLPACHCIQPLAGSTVLIQRVAWRGQCPDNRGLRGRGGDSLQAVRAWTGWVTYRGAKFWWRCHLHCILTNPCTERLAGTVTDG